MLSTRYEVWFLSHAVAGLTHVATNSIKVFWMTLSLIEEMHWNQYFSDRWKSLLKYKKVINKIYEFIFFMSMGWVHNLHFISFLYKYEIFMSWKLKVWKRLVLIVAACLIYIDKMFFRHQLLFEIQTNFTLFPVLPYTLLYI